MGSLDSNTWQTIFQYSNQKKSFSIQSLFPFCCCSHFCFYWIADVNETDVLRELTVNIKRITCISTLLWLCIFPNIHKLLKLSVLQFNYVQFTFVHHLQYNEGSIEWKFRFCDQLKIVWIGPNWCGFTELFFSKIINFYSKWIPLPWACVDLNRIELTWAFPNLVKLARFSLTRDTSC